MIVSAFLQYLIITGVIISTTTSVSASAANTTAGNAPASWPSPQQQARQQICADTTNNSFTFLQDKNKKPRKCTWLTKNATSDRRINKYCSRTHIKYACTLTCNTCDSICEDNPRFLFQNENGETQNCAWIQKEDAELRRMIYCYADDNYDLASSDIGNNCLASCGFCQGIFGIVPSSNNLIWEQIGMDIRQDDAHDDRFGHSVSLSSDGKVLAVGATLSDGVNGEKSGQVRLFYQCSNSKWCQIGNAIDGEGAGDQFGISVSVSSDGRTVAVGASRNDGVNGENSGHARVYTWDGSSAWNQLGKDIDGEAAGDVSGVSVSLSRDGKTVAIGASGNDGVNGENSGHARVYTWDGSSWNQLGRDIDGEAGQDVSGMYVSLSRDSLSVAIGALNNHGENGMYSGHVRVYTWTGFTWCQKGQDIDGEFGGDASGTSVTLNADGNVVAIGARGNHGDGYYYAGHVRVFHWDDESSTWKQLGMDINGEADGDFSGNAISLSYDGMTIAIGAEENSSGESGHWQAGHVRVYHWDGSLWIQLGLDIDGKAPDESLGFSVSLSDDGTTLAVSAIHNVNRVGHVQVYKVDQRDDPTTQE